jgi:hypothetical protein
MQIRTDVEPVLLVLGFWDQPREGIASYNGVPHRFSCPFDEATDDYAEFYLLAPISESALLLEREAWDIYFGHGPAPELPSVLPKPIPRFPEAKPRYDEIQLQLAEDRDFPARATIRARATFVRRECSDTEWTGRQLWNVAWKALLGE